MSVPGIRNPMDSISAFSRADGDSRLTSAGHPSPTSCGAEVVSVSERNPPGAITLKITSLSGRDVVTSLKGSPSTAPSIDISGAGAFIRSSDRSTDTGSKSSLSSNSTTSSAPPGADFTSRVTI